MAVQRFGSRSVGGLAERVDVDPPRPWMWVAWRRHERAEGVAADRPNAVAAIWHSLDPNDDTLDDEPARS